MNDDNIALAISKVRELQTSAEGKFLAGHTIRIVDNEPHVVRVDDDEPDGSLIVYFGLENKSYFLAVKVETTPTAKVQNVYVEAGSEAYLVCFSPKHPLSDILASTDLSPTEQWDMDAGGGSSGITIKTPQLLANAVDDNIRQLLDLLEQDARGIRNLSTLAITFVQVHWYGSGTVMPMLRLKPETLGRLAALNLSLDLDISVQS